MPRGESHELAHVKRHWNLGLTRALLRWSIGHDCKAVGMKRRRSFPAVQLNRSSFAGYRFPPDVIVLAVRWYLRFGLSYRDVEELLAERGIEVDHVTLYRWVQHFTPLVVDAARPARHTAGGRWFVDETYVKVAGVWRVRVAGRGPARPGHRRVGLHSTPHCGGATVLYLRSQ